jgi:hypothetical protein
VAQQPNLVVGRVTFEVPRHTHTHTPTAIVVRIPSTAWMFVCCVLSGRDLCDELITRSEESYQLQCVMCDHENLEEEAINRAGLQRQRIYIFVCVCVGYPKLRGV